MNTNKTQAEQLPQDAVISSTCDKGYKGDCCCNCKFQVKINKHPINPDYAKGSILETFGYGCEVFRFLEDGSNDNQIIFSKSIHGMCEMHVRK
ncbi:hypothetical protein filifjonk91_gp007 [Flavobacterium phage vB_FspS_filifjonk9-1]|uniref:Uncharacterized protein n=1 Tax=Flavobacterium phage vB_FspS_filifjonk9-1 TaxID=2686245 RepID=A0A6B9LL14_9CAUD|nr:hypothetical protein HWC87_gp07 [Flavobacterium phage vB_FspS_filifjonk9-1]QHB38624.1 hypothetical protein filifjonk91_gp007 [Flavobacterium phage vB_FspS_filifjonk9-1]